MTLERRNLKYASVDDAIVDVERLRAGSYAKAGRWGLPEICWHLQATTSFLMSAGPHAEPTPEHQTAGQARLQSILANGQIPNGIEAPERVVPPTNLGEDAIDEFLTTLNRLKKFNGPYAPHRLFGRLTDEQGQRLVLLHAAHHLSHLVPTNR